MFRIIVVSFCLCLAATLQAAEPTVPVAPVGLHVIHGQFSGHPFWFRLQAPDKQFGNNRVCELVYTPPAEKELSRSHLSDCPFLLVDSAARIVAWNGRDIGTKAVPAAPDGYAVTRERFEGEGDDRVIKLDSINIPGATGWDLRIAPILLALTWKADTSASVRLIDFFGPRHAEDLKLTWKGTSVTIADTPYTITPDQNGYLATLTATDQTKLLTITGRE